MSEHSQAARIAQRMMDADAFSQWLGIAILDIAPARCACQMTVRAEMTNGFGVAHGGIVFSVADSAFAFACNSHGSVTVSIENSITYPLPIHVGDVLTASAVEDAASNRLSYYTVTVTNQNRDTVAIFRGTAYKTQRPHFPEEGT